MAFHDARPLRRRRPDFCSPLIAIVVAGIALLAFAIPPAMAASPSPTANNPTQEATFGVGPANATKVDGRPNFEYFAGPGSQAIDHVAVVNLSNFAITVAVYVTDALNDATGDIGYEPSTAPKTDAASWIEIATPHGSGQVTLAARTTAILPMKLVVPPGASPGDHTVGVAVGLLTDVVSKNAKKITLEQRVVSKAFIRVSGPLHPGLKVEDLGASYRGTLNPLAKGSVSVRYVVKNTGNVNLSGKQRVSISGLFGSKSSVSTIASVPLLLPGGSFPVTLKVANAWPQIMVKGRASVEPLSAPGDVDPTLQEATAGVTFWAIPWTLLAIILVAILAAVFAIWRRRRRSSSAPPPPAGGHRAREPQPVR